jgi:hypothetical protein
MANNNKKAKPKPSFEEAVQATHHLDGCLKNGLQALGAHSKKISLSSTKNCNGSIDIDTALARVYPQDSRWDYAFSYKGEVFFVEVHTANSSEVDTVIKKLKWLKSWLISDAPKINELKATSQTPFHWIQSSNFNLPKTSRFYRRAAQEGILPKPILSLY